MNESASSAGIYFHFPFCEKKCPYCDFYSVLVNDISLSKYSASLKFESEKAAKTAFGSFSYDTIYIGGGTPSLLNPDELAGVLRNIYANFHIEKEAEITVECNPSSLTEEKIAGYLENGINRISLGVQSFDEANLKTLGRLHTAGDALEKFRLLRNIGFENINIDLIYGIPGQTAADWESDLATITDLGPEHISAYNLIIESGTEFGRLYEQNRLELPSDEEQSQMYGILNKYLSKAGYERYEISNFARPGFECRHNLKYWTGKPYLGLGPSAVSFDGKTRRKNRADIDKYCSYIERGDDIPCELEIIDRETAIREAIISGLRLTEGVFLSGLKKSLGYDIMEDKKETVDSLLMEGLITVEDGFMRLTDKALFISDSVMVKLI
jgi:oxygen-independent coproporphyrinogen-3 oxidase